MEFAHVSPGQDERTERISSDRESFSKMEFIAVSLIDIRVREDFGSRPNGVNYNDKSILCQRI